MNPKKAQHLLVAASLSVSIVSGCGLANVPNKTYPEINSSRKNGTIASMKLVDYPGQSPELNIYKVFYWSQDKKLEMYTLVPKGTGTNWLIVECHGGYDFPSDSTRLTPYTLSFVASDHYTKAVTIFPEYSGYGGSQGSIEGLSSNAIDVENAITAAKSLKNVDIQNISVDGVSMGGAVALMVASNPQYSDEISNVILTSPFPGWEVAETWDEQHRKSIVPGAEHQRQVEAHGAAVYGQFTSDSKAYQKNSPALNKITAPVLLLQGTLDHSIPWQMTQMLYQDLKSDEVNVVFDLVTGGNHGLTGKFRAIASNDIRNWVG